MSEVKSPAFQFYYKEWLTGTKSMSRVERDIYLFLLIDQFDTNNQLTCDEAELQRIAQVKTKSEKDALRYVIAKKFKPSDCGSFLVNKKMKDVITALQEYKEKQAKNGAAGGRPKKAVGYSGLTQTEPKKSSTTTTASDTELIHQQHAHEVFAEKLFSDGSALEKQQIELQLSERRLITREDTTQFNAHLSTEEKEHVHWSEWKSHLRNWLNTKPKQKTKNNNDGTDTKNTNLGRLNRQTVANFLTRRENNQSDGEDNNGSKSEWKRAANG